MNWRWSWAQAAALAAAIALAVQLLQGLVEVSCETLTFTPGQGVRFEARRRCRLNQQTRVVPCSRVDCAIIHEVRTLVFLWGYCRHSGLLITAAATDLEAGRRACSRTIMPSTAPQQQQQGCVKAVHPARPLPTAHHPYAQAAALPGPGAEARGRPGARLPRRRGNGAG